MNRLAFTSLLAGGAGCATFCALDLAGWVVTGGDPVGGRGWVAALAYLLPWYGLVALGLVGAARLAALGLDGLPALRERTARDLLREGLALSPAGALFAAVTYSVTLQASKSFNNKELAALLVTVATVAAGLLAVVLWGATRRLVTASPTGRKARYALVAGQALGGLTLLGAVAWIAYDNRAGLAILGPWLFAGPVGGAAAFVTTALTQGRWWTPRRDRHALVFAMPALAVVGIVWAHVDTTLGSQIARGTSWSSRMVHVLRAATDFDRDGFSSLFAGGDCAAFNREVHPAAREEPKDGIDNDCYGGDTAEAWQAPKPKWIPRPKELSTIENAVVIVVEALRPDAISFVNTKLAPPTTPNLDELARQSVVFPRTYASAAATLWSFGSLWTTHPPALLPWKRRPHNDKRYLDDDITFFYQYLQEAGLVTHGYTVDFYRLQLKHGIGLERGFTIYDERSAARKWKGFPSNRIVKKAIRRLDEVSKPFFMWLHLVEPHSPYVTHEGSPNFGKSSRHRYHSEVWGTDRQIGRFLDALRKRDLMSKTAVIVTGDHGEAFGEHGRTAHGSQAYEEQVRTSCVFWVPGAKHRVVEAPISHQDLGATLFNLLGVERKFDRLYGHNLMPVILGGEPDAERSIFLEMHAPRNQQVVLVRGDMKLIYSREDGSARLFDLHHDPGEHANVAGRYPEVYSSMLREILAYQAIRVEIE